MRLKALVERFYDAFPVSEAFRHVERLASYDRPQGSRGLERAAEYVALEAERAGLKEVELVRLPVDGRPHWWSFRAPAAWSPLRASLRLEGSDAPVAQYPEVACSLAVRSRPTPEGGLMTPLLGWSGRAGGGDFAGGVVVLPAGVDLPAALARLERSEALGFVTDATSRRDDAGERVGRLELPPDTNLFGFCVPTSAMEAVRAAAHAHALVSVGGAAHTPVVTARLAAATDEEILLLSHLCHTGPGANDNASGAAALLGVARVLAREPPSPARRSVRFLWGPEFVATAAYLRGDVGRPRSLPAAVIDLDMVGEDQRLCGGPMILERPPAHVASYLPALAEFCLESLPRESHSYSGAVPTAGWHWVATPFAGGSDHALFADRDVARPAVQLGHWPDRFNHTSADTLDKVDPQEIRRAATVAGALALFLAGAEEADAPDAERAVARWGAARIAEAAAVVPAEGGDSSCFDPAAATEVRGGIEHAARYAVAALHSLSDIFDGGGERRRRLAEWLRRVEGNYQELVGHLPAAESSGRGPVLLRRWEGPFNLHGLLEAAAPGERLWIRQSLARDKGLYALMLALALAVDDASDFAGVVRAAAYSSRLRVEKDFAERFFQILLDAGWAARRE